MSSRRRTRVIGLAALTVAVAAGAVALVVARGPRPTPTAPLAGEVAVASSTTAPAGGVRFTDVTAASGIHYIQSVATSIPLQPLNEIPFETGGVAAGDFDGDGWTDLFVTRFEDTPILYRNLGNGAFADVTPASMKLTRVRSKTGEGGGGGDKDAPPADETEAVPTNGAAWGDVNNDGQPDLFVQAVDHPRHYLFINLGDGKFAEEAVVRGVAHEYDNGAKRYGFSPAFGDYDRDGYLDLLTTEWGYAETGTRGTRLHRNLGAARPGHFEDVTEKAKVVQSKMVRPLSFAPRFTDLDRDGRTDIAVTSDYGTSRLFWNNGDGTFTDGTITAGVNTGGSEMGSTLGDYDGDGDLDWFISATADDKPTRGNRLYRNLGNRKFARAEGEAGVLDGGWGWGAAFVDYDNDADLDLIHTNGMLIYEHRWYADPTRVFRNEGGGRFTSVADAVGLSDNRSGKGLVTLDYDNDGDLDVFIVNNGNTPVLYRNDGGNANPWLKVKPVGGAGGGVRGATTNRDGFGTWVTVTDAALPHPLVWEVSGGSNYLGQCDPTAFFGLGPSFTGTIDRVKVQWPGGASQVFRDVAPNQLLEAREVDAADKVAGGAAPLESPAIGGR